MLAIRVGRVFDGEAVLLGIDTVMVDSGRIFGLLASSREDVDCPTVAFPDATLIPGLIDTHVHLCADGGPGALDRIPSFGDDELTGVIAKGLSEHLAAGVTTVRDLGDRSGAVLDWRRSADTAPRPTVIASGPPITSVGGHCWNMGGEANGRDELRRAVVDRAERGADVIKVMASGGAMTPGTDMAVPQFTADELSGLVREAHHLGLRVTAHAHAVAAVRAAVEAGVDGIEHCSFITPTGVDVDLDLVRRIADAGIVVCPTLGIAPGATPPPALLELMRKTGLTYETRRQKVAELHDAGMQMISGSDGGIGPGKPHGLLPSAVIDLTLGGVSAAAALASATSAAAQACGVGNRKGRIAEGFDADLLIVAGDLLADVGALRRPVAVYLRGERAS